ncbi:uncharacterized protein LOC144110925 [Amblyomma americanum]
MSRNTARFTLVLLAASSLVSGTIQNEECQPPPYEEDECNFAHQNASEAVKIDGKIYVISQNFNSTLPPLCDSAERVASFNDTYFNFTLAAVLPFNMTYVVKFNTSFVLSKTGNHTDYNAMTYKYETTQPPKLRKLMYMDEKKSCMIFIDDRNSTAEPARCQLLQPAKYADQNVTAECQQVYDDHCPGPRRTVYFSWCQNLTEVSIEDFMRIQRTTPAPQACAEEHNHESDQKPTFKSDALVANWRMVVQGLFGDMTSFRLSAAIMDRHQYLLRLSGEGSPDLALMPYAFTFPYFDQEAARAFNYAGVAEGLSRLFVDAYIGARRVGKVVSEFFACMEKSIPNKNRSSISASFFPDDEKWELLRKYDILTSAETATA